MKKGFKIMKRVFLSFIVLLISVMLLFSWFIKGNSKDYGQNSKVLKSDKVSNKKALVVYQPSKSKLTKKIAEQIAKGIKDEGYEITINYPGKHMAEDISQYSIIVFGSPVYVGETSSTLADYMKSIKDFSNKKILLFATGAQLENNELDKMEQNLRKIKATEKVGFKKGIDDESKAYEIGKKIAGE
ncbi:flavodoxin [Clostridium botulinum]|uniref:flavodoxin family protein n=1 Tax=Clostridium botulinum TaxID=1491 RepID=UPI00174D10B8|nr:flavodoxin domain-containing protein [Clostridium botulinum]MBD5638640.1 flavodoxin [Clostridium botulinum]